MSGKFDDAIKFVRDNEDPARVLVESDRDFWETPETGDRLYVFDNGSALRITFLQTVAAKRKFEG